MKELDDKEHAWLQRLEKNIDREWEALTGWEKKFLEDILENFRRYGRRTMISPRQWESIARISEKIIA